MPRFLPSLRRTRQIVAPVPPGFTTEQKTIFGAYIDAMAFSGGGDRWRNRDGWDVQRAVAEGYSRVVWVFKAVEAIAGNSSRLPFQLKDGEDIIDDHPLYRLLNHGKANPLESGRQFRKRLSAQVLLSRTGAFVEMTSSIGGDPIRLDLLPPARTRPVPGTGQDLISHFEVAQRNGAPRRIEVEKVRWVREPHPLDPFMGVTPLDAAGMSVELDYFARLYNVAFMRNDGRPGGVLGVEGDMEESDMDRIESRFGKGPVEAGKLSVVSGALTYVDTSKTPRDSAYQDASRNARDEIIVAFGTPLSQMGDATGKTFANSDAEGFMFWTQTMVNHNDMIASAFDEDSEEDLRGFLDTTDVEVLQRAEIARREEMRKEVAAGLRSIESYARESDIDVESTPQTRALWVPAGATPIASTVADEEVLGQAPPATGGGPGGSDSGSGSPGGSGGSGGGTPPDAPTAPPATDAPGSNVIQIGSAQTKVHLAYETKAAPPGATSNPPEKVRSRVETQVGDALGALAARQGEVVAARLGSPKARKGTKHWTPTGPGDTRLGTKALNGTKIVDVARWETEAERILTPIIEKGCADVAEAMITDLGLDAPTETKKLMSAADRKAVADAAAEALWVAKKSVEAHSKRLAQIIADRELGGATVDQIVQAVRDHTDGYRRGWSQVVATQVAQVVIEGTRVRVGNLSRSQRDIMREWVTRKDDRVRPTHRAAQGQKRRAQQPFSIGGVPVRYPGDPLAPHEETINCLIGDSRVGWPGQTVLNATRRRYSGPIIEFRTARGHVLTVTPNHPILTPDGYIPASLLRPGDDVIATDSPVGNDPQIGDVPPRVDEVYGAAREAGVEERVVGRGVDFHGDGVPDEDVYVVRADSDLANARDTEIRERGGGGFLIDVGDAPRPRAGTGTPDETAVNNLRRSGPFRSRVTNVTATTVMGGGGQSATVVAGQPRHPQQVGFTPVTDRQAEVGKAINDRCATHAEVTRHTEDTLSVGVAQRQVGGVRSSGLAERSSRDGGSEGQPGGLEMVADGVGMDAEVTRHLAHAMAVGMTPCKVISVDVRSETHDVYNLSTSDAWYTANGIGCHNCRCWLRYSSRATRKFTSPPAGDVTRNPQLARKVRTWAVIPPPPRTRPVLAVANMEGKLRHVRTPAGVEQFGLPIDSPIVPRPDVPALPKGGGQRLVTDAEIQTAKEALMDPDELAFARRGAELLGDTTNLDAALTDNQYKVLHARYEAEVPAETRRVLDNGYFASDDSFLINEALRDGDPPTDNIGAMQAASRAWKLPDPVQVHRGMWNMTGLPDDLTGALWEDAAFQSTTFDRGRAITWAQSRGTDVILMDVRIPKGTRVALGHDQMELLLPDGAKLRVVSDKFETISGSKVRVITLAVETV